MRRQQGQALGVADTVRSGVPGHPERRRAVTSAGGATYSAGAQHG